MKRLLALTLVLGTLYVIAEFGAKAYVETRMENEAAANAPGAQHKGLISFPPLFQLVARGKLEFAELETTDVPLGPINASSVTARAFGVAVDLGASIERREPVITSVDRFRVTVEIADTELSRLLPQGLHFEVSVGSMTLRTPAGTIEGQITSPGGSRLEFEADQALPRGVGAPSMDLGTLPFDSCIDSIDLIPGRVRLTCEIEEPTAPFPPSP